MVHGSDLQADPVWAIYQPGLPDRSLVSDLRVRHSVTLLLSRFTDDPLAVFALAMLLCGTLEYLTSYIMEKACHARWWDYSAKKFNLNGRVCADTLIPFGLVGLGMIYFVKP